MKRIRIFFIFIGLIITSPIVIPIVFVALPLYILWDCATILADGVFRK